MIKKMVVTALTGIILATTPAFPTDLKQTVTLEQQLEKSFPSEKLEDIDNWMQYSDKIMKIIGNKMGYEIDENIPKPRIVACVNACAGIPTNTLLNGIIKKMITACKAIEDNWESGDLAAAARLCSQAKKDLEKKAEVKNNE